MRNRQQEQTFVFSKTYAVGANPFQAQSGYFRFIQPVVLMDLRFNAFASESPGGLAVGTSMTVTLENDSSAAGGYIGSTPPDYDSNGGDLFAGGNVFSSGVGSEGYFEFSEDAYFPPNNDLYIVIQVNVNSINNCAVFSTVILRVRYVL